MIRSATPFETGAHHGDLANVAARPGLHWQPGLGGSCHNEVFACAGEASGAATALALALDDWRCQTRDAGPAKGAELEDRRSVLWVQTRQAVKLAGRPYRAGLPSDVRHRVIHVLAEKPEDALFALEEGVRCRDVAFVMGEITGNPNALDFTASRRLTLTAQRNRVPLYLVRLDAARDLSSARMRWDVAAEPSPPPQWDANAPGPPTWRAELFRARTHAPGEWLLYEQKGCLKADRPCELIRETLGQKAVPAFK